MKKIFQYTLILFLGAGLCSCEALFDNLEGDLTKMTEDDMITSVEGLERLLSDVYNSVPMDDFNKKDRTTDNATPSRAADYSVNITSFWDYTKMRSINLFIRQVDNALEKKYISQESHDKMLGEALFVRAYCYFASVRAYGGIPLVTEPLDDKYDGGENAELYVPRSTEKEAWDFVLSELDKAIALLPETRNDGPFRATKWSALGLQSRVALYAASVSKYWNREAIPSSYKAVAEKLTYMEASYADAYYAKCIEASEKIINSGQFSLYGGATTSVETAKANLTNLFLARQDCEFLYGKSYESGVATATNGFDLSSSPNQAHETGTNVGWGTYSITSDLVDLYDDYDEAGGRVDGTVKTRNDGVEDQYSSQLTLASSTFSPDTDYIQYDDPSTPFLNKDARFQAWVLYPGCSFRGVTIISQGGMVKHDGSYSFYKEDTDEVGGKVYQALGGTATEISGFYDIDNSFTGYYYNSAFGIRKFLNPDKALLYSVNPWYDIRYAEILLNYAEAVAESGKGSASKAKQVLNDIRHRAAFTDDIDLTVENVLHERRVEMAFEGDYTYTLHRRREYLNNRSGVFYRKHTVVPTLDLRSGSPKYLMVRANIYHGDVDKDPLGLNVDLMDYYMDIPNPEINNFTPNPSQE
ncbi:MAG: RagB/SusD family nutrient uptake outer membrane protein [Bacteroidales bacterium]|nr:RagB/SusD family nutrient uptake outer membrane protein [Bacteroidales bacterium]